MKKLTLVKGKDDDVFGAIYYALLSETVPLLTAELAMHSRLVEMMDGVSEPPDYDTEGLIQRLEARAGQTLLGVAMLNRKLDQDVDLEIQDEDFRFLQNRVNQTRWIPMHSLAAHKLSEYLIEAKLASNKKKKK